MDFLALYKTLAYLWGMLNKTNHYMSKFSLLLIAAFILLSSLKAQSPTTVTRTVGLTVNYDNQINAIDKQIDSLKQEIHWAIGGVKEGQKREWALSILKPALSAKALPSLTAAQAIVESGWGTRTIGNFNIFGIKGKGNQVLTTEYINGHPQKLVLSFQKYNSLEAAFKHHSKILLKPNLYKMPTASRDYRDWVWNLKRYATNPKYCLVIKGIIARYNLQNLDRIQELETKKALLFYKLKC